MMNRPLRITVASSSVGYFVRPPGEDRSEGCYAERVNDLLAAAAVPNQVSNQSYWLGEIHDAFHHIEARVLAFSPDVVVIDFGWLECQPQVFPTALLRWLTTYRPRLNPRTMKWRRKAARRISRLYKKLTPAVASRWPGVSSRMPPERFEQELTRYIDVVRKELRALVLVTNLNPTSDRVAEVLPGVHERTKQYSDIIERVVERADPDVRLVDTRSLVEGLGVDKVLPDGIHYNVEGHRLVADMLVAEIMAWLAPAR
jgi:lysophospholipase L1-like esterase